ncbi:lytic transglycosylase domain-containing protein [Crenobacter sp. SG2303]|uniref:Lytic transglycosylase domain-containing protein n=1 Tax=Crenobacter oryzisoli TaxID=3056844 RepID=A0ABT7XLT6_9NEIS|nr:lytic transglycosylase domain-containing protein [Crenobacter sp. SG2303]MDN0074743.1 lytic transglycosylase domain-containing protein [Crenobacter sp. SG2303]
MRRLFAALSTALVLLPAAVHAEVWGFVDPHGEVHLADRQLDKRYQLFTRSGEIGATLPSKGLPQVSTPAVPAARAAQYRRLVEQTAREYNLDPELLHAIITVESGYTPGAVSPKGAVGLMQVMPATGERFGITALDNPKANLRAGSRYLKFLLTQFNQELPLVLAAYNAGEGAVQQYQNSIPPFPETRDYVAKVLAVYQRTGVPVGHPVGHRRGGRVSATIAPDQSL